MTAELARVTRAAERKRVAEYEYRAIVRQAVGAGRSYADVARAAGVSRQAVWQLVNRPNTKEER